MEQNTKTDKIRYPSLFSPLKVETYHMVNRLVALPVHTGFAHTDGRASPWMEALYTRLADSGVAMVIVANAAVSHDGAVSKFNLRVDRDELIPGLTRLARTIKQRGAIACLQLNHAGRFAKTKYPLLPSPIIRANLSFNMESLKDFMHFFPFEKRFNLTRAFIRQVATWRYAMTAEDRERVMDDFASAALRAYQAGFDMVELHGANGYLLCQYLSAFTNKLQSDSGFGGDFQGRAVFPLEVVKRVKKKLPINFPVGFRLILREWVPNGIDLPEALAFATLLEKERIAYLSASVGTYNSILSPEILKHMDRPTYLDSDVATLTAKVNIPTIISGRITTPSQADTFIREGTADLIGLGRSLRTDPRWVTKAKTSCGKIIKCTNCNWCLKRVILEKGFNCRLWPKLYQERTKFDHKMLTRNDKTLWIKKSKSSFVHVVTKHSNFFQQRWAALKRLANSLF
ncbi:MAG: NADH:flavin oxidoreductase [Desulfobacterium sp.]